MNIEKNSGIFNNHNQCRCIMAGTVSIRISITVLVYMLLHKEHNISEYILHYLALFPFILNKAVP